MVFWGVEVFSGNFLEPFAHVVEGEAEFVEKEIKAMQQAVREAVKIPLYDLSYFGAHNDLRGYSAR